MTKTYLLIISLAVAVAAQSQVTKQNYISVHAGYGSENNIGNPGFFGGIGSETTIGKKFTAEVSLSYFRDNGEQLYTNAKEKYRALFAAFKTKFLVIGTNQSFFQTKFAAGPALKYYHYKGVANMYIRINPDGTEAVREPVIYYNEQVITFSVYAGLDFSFKLSDKMKADLFLDTYSHEILLEHFMPGVKLSIKL